MEADPEAAASAAVTITTDHITEVIGDGTIHGTAHIIITTDGTTLTGATTIIIRDTARAMSLEEVTKTHGMD